MTGGKLNLNAQERLANDIIIKHKLKEVDNINFKFFNIFPSYLIKIKMFFLFLI